MLRKMTTALCLLGASTIASAEPTTTTGPNVKLIIAPRQLTSQTGFALMGEVGEKMARVNATLGYQIGLHQRLKLSVDQLVQKLKYDFFLGDKSVWMQQIAGGASYKYFLDDYGCWFDSIDAGGWYSNAPNRKLSSITLTTSDTTTRTFERMVAGSEAWHAYLGATLFPWEGATLGLAAVYDNVEYRRETFSDRNVSGIGFSFDFGQRLYEFVDLTFRGDFLQPYQHVGGDLNWTFPTPYGNAIVGLYGDYTRGKEGLPNNTTFGIQINLAFGSTDCLPSFYQGCCSRDNSRPRQDLLEWLADPAVKMPIVLAIAEQCTPPVAGLLPDVIVDLGPYAVDVSTAFLGGQCRGVRYSASGLPPESFIDVDSGIIFGTNLGLETTPFNVTVKCECICGSTTSSFILTLENL